jgi:hypothetical protein
MNLQNLKYAYEILDNIFEKNIAFSLGGYHSLVKQNMLKEFRPINDIDINIIIDSEASASGLMQDRIIDCFRDFTSQRSSTSNYILRLNTKPERDYYEKKLKQTEQNLEIESDLYFSISLTAENIATTKNKMIQGEDLSSYSPLTNIYSSNDLSPGFYFGGTTTDSTVFFDRRFEPSIFSNPLASFSNPPAAPVTSNQNIKEKKDPMVFVPTYAFNNFIRKQIFDKLVELVLSNNNELKIDFFLMEHDPKHNQIFVIEKENYTAYYPILRAKHRYCTEKFTPEKSFRKHILDLSLSFNAKRIRGLNYPEDIELLIKNWREAHEESK